MDQLETVCDPSSGEIEELRYGQRMLIAKPEGVQVKIVITARGIAAIALADEESSANSMLQRLGFAAERIESKCVGACCFEQK